MIAAAACQVVEHKKPSPRYHLENRTTGTRLACSRVDSIAFAFWLVLVLAVLVLGGLVYRDQAS